VFENIEEEERKKREKEQKTLTSSSSISPLFRSCPASTRALAWNNTRLEPGNPPPRKRDGVAIDDDICDDARLASAPASLLSASARSLVAARMSVPGDPPSPASRRVRACSTKKARTNDRENKKVGKKVSTFFFVLHSQSFHLVLLVRPPSSPASRTRDSRNRVSECSR
jgi:hypothetical protein